MSLMRLPNARVCLAMWLTYERSATALTDHCDTIVRAAFSEKFSTRKQRRSASLASRQCGNRTVNLIRTITSATHLERH